MYVGPDNMHLVRVVKSTDKHPKAEFECPECGSLNVWRIDKVVSGVKRRCRKCNFKYFPGGKYGPKQLELIELLPNDRASFRCTCGNVFIASRHDVGSWHTQSCGCYRSEVSSRRRTIDLTGQRFGRLLVLERGKKNHKNKWKCICDCGNVTYVTTRNLRKGQTQSCGCLQRERAVEANEFHLEGKHFGQLTVLHRINDANSHDYKKWLCLCSCGRKVSILTSELTSGMRFCCTHCSRSRSLGERLIDDILDEYNIRYVPEKTFGTCRSIYNNRRLKFDFYIPEISTCIEYDGRQHFNIESFKSKRYAIGLSNDITKDEWCADNDINLIRIPYTYYDALKSSHELLINIINGTFTCEQPERQQITDDDVRIACDVMQLGASQYDIIKKQLMEHGLLVKSNPTEE